MKQVVTSDVPCWDNPRDESMSKVLKAAEIFGISLEAGAELIAEVDETMNRLSWQPEPEPSRPSGGWRLPIAHPDLTLAEQESVLHALERTWISGATPVVREVEEKFAAWIGTRHAVACNSGGSALHLLVRALDYPPGSEIICPSFTMIATAAAISLAGHVPVFVDCEPGHLTVDPNSIIDAISERTKAVMAVHLYGHPAGMDSINEVAANTSLDVLEDAAEAHGAARRTDTASNVDGYLLHHQSRKCGSLGRAAAFGFYGNKVLTCGEGGMVTTDDEELAARVRDLSSYCFDPRYHFWHADLGHSMRMNGLAAALLSAQIDRAEVLIVSRELRAEWYAKHLREEAISSWYEPDCRSCWWHYWVRVSDRQGVRRKLAEIGVETRPGFTPMHVQPCYSCVLPATEPRDRLAELTFHTKWNSRSMPCPEAERAGREVLLLPTHCGVTENDVRRICDVINSN